MSIADIILYIHEDAVVSSEEPIVPTSHIAHEHSTALTEDPDPFFILWSVLVNKTAPL